MDEATIDPFDRSDWPSGPWDDEPDTASWRDEQTGLACRALRAGDGSGAWCGYVGVEPGHPLHGKSRDEAKLDAHGGVNFAGTTHRCEDCQDKWPLGMWWFGFDCAHAFDVQPGMAARFPGLARLYFERRGGGPGGWSYKTLGFVRHECAHLARQLKDAERR